MNSLCYMAIPKAWESPKGLMIRNAFHNGYRNVASMCAALKVPCSGDGLDLLTEQSTLFNRFTMAAPEIAHSLLANTYSVSAALWFVDEITLNRSHFAHYFMFCPECLRDELITVFQDLQDLPVCPLHQTQIVTHCPFCHEREHWTTANLFFCKCGYDRRNTESLGSTFADGDRVESFGPDTYIRQLSSLTSLAQKCEDIWHSRQPCEGQRSCCFLEAVRTHAANMFASQLENYPGFTHSMNLSPWISSHPILSALAVNFFNERTMFNENCLAKVCCADIKLTLKELTYCIGGWDKWPKDKNFISKNFEIHKHRTGARYYRCHTPICSLVRFGQKHLHLSELEKEDFNFNYLSVSETAKLLHCSNGAALQLADLGYLQTSSDNCKPRNGHRTFFKKKSVDSFNNSFILVRRISNLLQTNSVRTARLLNQFGISADHEKLGPKVYDQHIINASLEQLKKVLKNPLLLSPIASPLNQGVQNALKLADANKTAEENLNPNHMAAIENRDAPDCLCYYSVNQAATLLKITCRYLNHRFVRSGLVKPEFIDGIPHYSPRLIEFMNTHLQLHVTIEQATKLLKYGHYKTVKMINLFRLQPSCTLVYSNGNRQVLYKKSDISALKNRLDARKNWSWDSLRKNLLNPL